MMRFRRVLSGLVPGLVLAAPVTAQVHEHGAEHQDSLGRVRFEVSCNAAARERFPRAVALLHSFWWEETERAFADVAAADSTCGMAYWGLAMAYWRNPFGGGPIGDLLRKGQAAAERAVALGARTRRERGYIAAAAALYRDAATLPSAVRLRAYSDSMEQTQRSHPGDSEAAIFYALSLVATAPATDTTFTRQRRAASILNPIFRAQPQHPGLAHYLIHANDSPQLASLGLDAARRYARIAPAAPHAQHMPSHIFIRLGLWDEAIASNQAAYRAGAAYFEQRGQRHVATEEYHAMDYMVYAYLQEGRDSIAARIAAEADATDPAVPPVSPGRNGHPVRPRDRRRARGRHGPGPGGGRRPRGDPGGARAPAGSVLARRDRHQAAGHRRVDRAGDGRHGRRAAGGPGSGRSRGSHREARRHAGRAAARARARGGLTLRDRRLRGGAPRVRARADARAGA